MHCFRLIPALLFSLAALPGCDSDEPSPECEKLAKHITEVYAEGQQPPTPQAARDKAVTDLTAACLRDQPGEEAMACAMKADTREALAACDPKDADAKAEEGKKEAE